MFSYQNLHKYIPIKIGISSVFRSIVRALAGLHITIMMRLIVSVILPLVKLYTYSYGLICMHLLYVYFGDSIVAYVSFSFKIYHNHMNKKQKVVQVSE